MPGYRRNSFFAVHKMRIPHSNQEMLALEHSFDPSTSLTASAIVSRGYSLWNVYDLNLAKPTRGANYGIDDVNGKNVGLFSTPIWTTVTNANYAHIYNVDNGDSSWYAGLTAQFKRRFSQNLSVEADYTWSHAIDDIGNPIGGLAGAASYDNATRNDMGPSQFDRRHRANITFVWQPKVGKNVMPVARQLLNDWQISGFATIATNPPFTPTLIVQGQQLSGQATLYTNSLNGSGGWNNVPWESIGSLRWGIMAPVNLRLTRTLRFGERLKAQLSFEAYNALNTQYNTSLNTIGYIVKSAIAKPVANVGTGNAAWGWIDGTNARRAQVSLRLSF